MGNIREHKRECKYCNKRFKTTQKFSEMCDECKEERFKERMMNRVCNSKSYWKRFLGGEEI